MNKRDHVMNALLLGGGLGYLLGPGGDGAVASVLAVGVPVLLGALVPDIDTVIGRHRQTLHNLPVLLGFLAFPIVFGNLQYVWIGVAAHYVLDVAGNTRGIALFYPFHRREYGLPVGVRANSHVADVVTLLITIGQLAGAIVLLDLWEAGTFDDVVHAFGV